MRIATFHDISCDKCNRWASSDWGMSFFNTKQEAKGWAKKNKWKQINGENVCFPCLAIDHLKSRILLMEGAEKVLVEHNIRHGKFYIKTNGFDGEIVRNILLSFGVTEEEVWTS